MSRLTLAFERARQERRAALVGYLMAGDPDLERSYALALAVLRGGADVLELGMPFSDPVADGPVLQRASERALAAGTDVEACLGLAARLRRASAAPIALMGYANPLFAYGLERFVRAAVAAGVDAVIVPDLPPEEAQQLRRAAAAAGLATVFLVAPTSTEARARAACEASTGFVYLVSFAGVTGAGGLAVPEVAARLGALRRVSRRPVVVGFGISTPAQAGALAVHADGVVAGSAIVSRIAEGGTSAEVCARVEGFVTGLRRALCHPTLPPEERT